MSDLIRRAEKAKLLAGDTSLPTWERLSQGLEALSGLQLTGLADEVRGPLEASLASVNGVLDQYPPKAAEGYRAIDDSDLQRMLDIIDAAASAAIAAELNRIVAELDASMGKLPVDAIREVREHRDLMVPKLIEVLREATSRARAGRIPQGEAQFFAVFLLTEFRAAEALPAILEAFSLPGELPDALFGDAATCTLPRILAFFVGDRPEVVDKLIGDPALNEWVRWGAAETYVYLVRDGRLSRDDAVRRLQQHLRQAVDRSDSVATNGLVSVLDSLAAKEALEDITEAFNRELVDLDVVDLETVRQSIAEGDSRVREELEMCLPTGIEDTIDELRGWGCFDEKPAPQPKPLPPALHFATAEKPAERAAERVLSGGGYAESAAEPVVSSSGRVGRNDPCPCGSGKKYKKCCGGRK